MKAKTIRLEDYEKRDPLWWCQYYKGSVGILCIRIEQYLNAETEERKKTLESLINVLLDNFKEKGIGVVIPYESENNGEGTE